MSGIPQWGNEAPRRPDRSVEEITAELELTAAEVLAALRKGVGKKAEDVSGIPVVETEEGDA